ncbi:antimicrobial peptide ABC transporter permease [Lacticaseibacillus zeae DSM 20178 = KCTC 3804]|uniref:Antimicrobial peptide ABC transporter permease n=1 Tax=Lacticaseibacillus zeae DSM 20178 = KCTC 3804 TaxID=1423816 RepID=A0A0R1F2H8_LACZE|nr:antimicrobial peptide ABC transporter permease [Lacticaseibacillus zeae DSM 20178 = KCTC 3804]
MISLKPLTKNLWRNIRDSLGRFIAIVIIIMLGVLLFVGVKATGPALKDSLNTTVKADHLADSQLLATTGVTNAQVKAAQSVSGTQAEAVKFKYAIGGKASDVVALYGYRKTATINRLHLTSGHLPNHHNEIVLDSVAKKSGYKLGQHYTFARSSGLSRRTYTITGFADSPAYIEDTSRGSANIGDGTVRYFAYIPDQQMNMPVASQLNIRFPGLQKRDTFSSSYKDAVAAKMKQVKRRVKAQAQKDLQTMIEAKIVQAATKKATAQATAAGMPTSAAATTAQTAVQKQQATLKKQADTRAQKQLTTSLTWQTRSDLPGFGDYGGSADRIAAIANVFPVFFFLVAALITFTTVSRMVEEARAQIGTFKALGYSKWAIARNYLAYAALAGLFGGVIGVFAGNLSIPRIVLSLYKNYIPLKQVITLQWPLIVLSIGLALIATLGAAIIVVRNELTEKPAALMRPRAPKSAKRILLERITPLWSRLSFNQKVSYRNLFRYKSRLIMTILGIAGGTALILTGFGIKDSITATGSLQYNDVVHYQAIVRLADGKTPAAARTVLKKSNAYRSADTVSSAVGKLSANGHQISDVNLFAPSSGTTLEPYVSLRSTKTNQKLTLPLSGIVITSKVAKSLKVGTGDHLKITTTDGKKHSFKIKGIAKNYVGHFAYLANASYRQLAGQHTTPNALLVRLRPQTTKQNDRLAKRLLNHHAIVGISFTTTAKKTLSNMSSMLDPIVLIFILLSAVLSFVVLYNLNNINVSERIRELSTIKVLGFFDREVTMYISRESIVQTIVGILFGYGLGNLLTAYILQQAETADVVFPLTISFTGYLTATLLMIGFTAIVTWLTHRRLQRVDMVEALKSNE